MSLTISGLAGNACAGMAKEYKKRILTHKRKHLCVLMITSLCLYGLQLCMTFKLLSGIVELFFSLFIKQKCNCSGGPHGVYATSSFIWACVSSTSTLLS